MKRGDDERAAAEIGPDAQDHGAAEHARQTGEDEGPMRIVYALNTSSSMREGNKIGKVKEELARALGELLPSDTFNIIVFNSNITAFTNAPVSATPANVTNATVFINEIQVGDGANMLAAMDLAFSMPEITHLYLMATSDPNCGLTEFGALRRYIREKNTCEAKIMTLALGNGDNFASLGLLKGIAEDNNGTYNYINLSMTADASANPQAE